MIGKASELKVNDQWVYGGVIYTVERDEETNELYFKHPSEKAGRDDHIAIEHISEGEIIYKEGAS
jgi:hypothetical protein